METHLGLTPGAIAVATFAQASASREEHAVPEGQQVVVPEKRGTIAAVVCVEINPSDETIRIDYTLETASGEGVRTTTLTLEDGPAKKGFSNWMNATGTIKARNAAALKAAGVL